MTDDLRNHLNKLARRLVGPADAEELAQEAVARLLQAGKRVAPDNHCAYARRIVLRLAVDRIRNQRLQFVPAEALERYADSKRVTTCESDEVDQLYVALARLPARQAAVVTLRMLTQLEYDEIAHLMQTSAANCRSLCRYGLLRLKSELAPTLAPNPPKVSPLSVTGARP